MAAPALAADSSIGAPPVIMGAYMPLPMAGALPPMRNAQLGEWTERRSQTGGFRQPYYGYQLPREWIVPSYFIGNFGSYGLAPPAAGFGWSRYYDDAVLTDRWGRVYDWRNDVDWDHARDYRGDRGYDRHDDYRRDRSRGRHYDYRGRWTGSWDGGPTQTYEGEWHGEIHPHWTGEGESYGRSYRGSYGGDGYGYDAGGTTVTTVVIPAAAPVVTSRTVSYDVVSYAPARKRVVRYWRPRGKAVRLR